MASSDGTATTIGTLVLTGIATSGVVLSTLRQAADLDYQLIVLTEKIFPRQADVRLIADWKLYMHETSSHSRV